jgi:LmbE family N-acetylglucosaminyl deacetylase
MKVLVMACHADDEILGCGGVICKHLEEGDEVHVCVVTQPIETEWSNQYFKWDDKVRATKLEEQESVDTFLGITRHFLKHSVLELNRIGRALFNYSIQLIIDKISPDIIYTHWEGDLNYMHQMVGLATVIATRPPKKITVYMYEMESSRFAMSSFKPNYYVDISKYIDKKINAFCLYKSEYRNDIHPRNAEGITTFAKYRGQEVGLEYAEAFILMKEVIE